MTKSINFVQRVFNSSVGQFQLIETTVIATFKPTVTSQSDLPLFGNTLYDAIITLDFNHLFIWNGTKWVDQGAYDSNDDVITESVPGPTEVVNSFALTGQEFGDVVKWNGSNWVPGTPTNNAGAGVTLYLDNASSGILTYKSLSSAPSDENQRNDVIILNNDTQYFPNVYASGALGGTQIDGGDWVFDIYRWVSTNYAITYISFEVYKRDLSGTETLLFITNTKNILDTVVFAESLATVQPAFPINPTDVLVIKVKATTNQLGHPVTVYYSYDGVNNYSHIHTPIILRHNQLPGLQGGQANQYNHLTDAELAFLRNLMSH